VKHASSRGHRKLKNAQRARKLKRTGHAKKPRRELKGAWRSRKSEAPRRVSKHALEKPAITYPEKPLPAEIPPFAKSVAAQLEEAAEVRRPEAEPAAPEAKAEGEGSEMAFAERAAEAAKLPEESLWLEVRPFVGQEIRAAHFLDLMSVLHGLNKTFEYLIASGPDPSELGKVPYPKRVVRYFIRCPDAASKELVKNVLRSVRFAVEERALEFEGGKLLLHDYGLRIEYPLEAELELESHFGSKPLFPEVPTYERSFEQFIDVPKNIHAAVLLGGALRFVARRNDRAPVLVKVPGASMDGRAVGSALSYHLGGFMRAAASMGRPDGAGEERRPPPQPVDMRALQEVQRRIQQPWFSCDVRAYGTQEQISSIVSALSFTTNRCRVFKHRRCAESRRVAREGRKKKPGKLRSFLARLLLRLNEFLSGFRPDPSLQRAKSAVRLGAIFLYPAILFLLWVSGTWKPDILSSAFDQALLAAAALLPLVLRSAWRMRKTIALTIGELSLLVSLPSKPERGQFYFAEAGVPAEVREAV
jgi:hypothetical protein